MAAPVEREYILAGSFLLISTMGAYKSRSLFYGSVFSGLLAVLLLLAWSWSMAKVTGVVTSSTSWHGIFLPFSLPILFIALAIGAALPVLSLVLVHQPLVSAYRPKAPAAM